MFKSFAKAKGMSGIGEGSLTSDAKTWYVATAEFVQWLE